MDQLSKQECALCLVRAENRILFVRKSYDMHLWSFPGGIVEPDESYAQAAVRELNEETGLEGKVNCLVCFRTRSNQTIAVFYVDILGGELLKSVPGEIDAIRWFTKDELDDQSIELFSGFVARKAISENLPTLRYSEWRGGSGAADMFL